MQQFSYLREKPFVDYLKIIANVGTLVSAESFSNLGAILSSPEALETLISQYKWNTSSAVTVCVSKVVFTGVIYASAGLLVYGKASASCEAKQCPGGQVLRNWQNEQFFSTMFGSGTYVLEPTTPESPNRWQTKWRRTLGSCGISNFE